MKRLKSGEAGAINAVTIMWGVPHKNPVVFVYMATRQPDLRRQNEPPRTQKSALYKGKASRGNRGSAANQVGRYDPQTTQTIPEPASEKALLGFESLRQIINLKGGGDA